MLNILCMFIQDGPELARPNPRIKKLDKRTLTEQVSNPFWRGVKGKWAKTVSVAAASNRGIFQIIFHLKQTSHDWAFPPILSYLVAYMVPFEYMVQYHLNTSHISKNRSNHHLFFLLPSQSLRALVWRKHHFVVVEFACMVSYTAKDKSKRKSWKKCWKVAIPTSTLNICWNDFHTLSPTPVK